MAYVSTHVTWRKARWFGSRQNPAGPGPRRWDLPRDQCRGRARGKDTAHRARDHDRSWSKARWSFPRRPRALAPPWSTSGRPTRLNVGAAV